jgi:hypothetical protein
MKEKTLYKSTTISPERSKAEIDKMLKDFGIGKRAWLSSETEDILIFDWTVNVNGVQKTLNFELRPPDIRQTKRVWNQKTYRTEKVNVRNDAVAYRLLYNYVKNKLEAIRVGMVTVENEFMAQIQLHLKNGASTTMGQELAGMIVNRKIENALEYREIEPQEVIEQNGNSPRNVTNE